MRDSNVGSGMGTVIKTFCRKARTKQRGDNYVPTRTSDAVRRCSRDILALSMLGRGLSIPNGRREEDLDGVVCSEGRDEADMEAGGSGNMA